LTADHRARITELVTGAGWLLGLRAALQLLALLLGSAELAQAAVGALVVDLAAGRAGIAWAAENTARNEIVRRVVRAGAVSLVVVGASLVIARLAGYVSFAPGHADTMVLLSLLSLTATAIRDELLFRALPLHFAERARVPLRFALPFAAALSATPFVVGGASIANIALAFASGLLFASAYVRLGGVWAAVAAHLTWSVVVGPVTKGLLFEASWVDGQIAEGPAAAGAPALITAALAVVAALLVLPRLAAPTASEPAPVEPEETPARKKKKKRRVPDGDATARPE
jgi:membrane protease YdiL (CAAX protease family)